MAFQGMGDLTGQLSSLSVSQSKFVNFAKTAGMGLELMGKSLAKTYRWNEKVTNGLKKGTNSSKKWVKGFAMVQDTMKKTAGILGGMTSIGLDLFGVFMQLAEKMGILQPIMQMITSIFEIMGGAAMETFVPAMQELFAVLFSDDMLTLWQDLGSIIGEFMSYLMEVIIQLFSDPQIQKMIKIFLKMFMSFLKIFVTILGGFFKFLSALPIPLLIAFMVLMAGIIGFFWGMAKSGGNPVIGAIMGGIAAAGMAVIGTMATMAEGGIVTKPTFAMIGEAGPEAVVPLSEEKGFGNNDEVVWALEENTNRLDRLIGAVETQNRIKRLKNL